MTRVLMASASDMRTDARVSREASSLISAGYSVRITCFRSEPAFELAGIELDQFHPGRGPRALRLLLNLLRLSWRILRTRADVYHAHNVHTLPASWVAARLRRAHVVYDAHELFQVLTPAGRGGRPSWKQRAERKVERALAPRADIIFTASERYADAIAEPLNVSRPVVIPNHPPLPPANLDSPLREAVGAADGELLILYQGGFYLDTRALEVVVDAMALLPSRYRLVLIGFGFGDEAEFLTRRAHATQVADRVTVLPAVSHDELPRWTAGADVGIIPFRLTSPAMQLCSPNKLYEYLGAGIPVVASAADELVAVLADTGAGTTYDYDDAEDFAERLQSLGTDRETLAEIGAKGRAAASDAGYAWEAHEHRLLDAYRGLGLPNGNTPLPVFAPAGITEQTLALVTTTLGRPPESLFVIVLADNPSLAAEVAGAGVVGVRRPRSPVAAFRLLPTALRLRRLVRHTLPARPILVLGDAWFEPYRLGGALALRLLGMKAWDEIEGDGQVRTSNWREHRRMIPGAVQSNLRAFARARRLPDRIRSLAVPRSRQEVQRILYLRWDLGMAIRDEPGGSLSHSRGVIGAMQDAGLDVTVVAPRPIEAPGRPPPRFVDLEVPLPSNLHPELTESEVDDRLERALDRVDLPAVDVVYQRYGFFSTAGLRLAAALRVPFVLEVNCSEVRFRRQYSRITFGTLGTKFEAALFEAASVVVTVSDRVSKEVRHIAPGARVITVPNGVDALQFTDIDALRASTRERLGFAPDDVAIGFVGRFYQWHGIDTLTAAIPEVLDRAPTSRFLLVGDGAEREPAERALQRYGNRVLFTGLVAPPEIPALLSACDILVSPHAPIEGFIGSPMKLFEYMAAGRCVVASRLEQLADVIDAGVNGALFEPGDAAALTDILVELIGDPERRASLARAAREDAITEHTWQAKLETILDSVRNL